MTSLRTTLPTLLLAALLLGSLAATPATAQESDDLPTVDFAVKAMQGAQYFRVDADGSPAGDAEFGFQRVRVNLEVSAQLHERVSAFVDFGHEPNDFGTGGDSFSPAVDFVALDLMLSETLTLRLGTPVTGLFNFRGYSDGAAVQGNPLIGNSPIDFVTAETGIQLIGSTETAGFDLTMTSPTFFETFAPGTGFTLIAKGTLAPSEALKVGAAVAQGTNGATIDRGSLDAMNLITGDGENYNAAGLGQPNRYTHAYLVPGASATLVQVDAQAAAGPLTLDGWGGIGFEGDSFARRTANGDVVPTTPRLSSGEFIDESSQMWWAGLTAKVDATERFFLAGRFSYAANSSDWASRFDETSLYRLQGGFGVSFWDVGMWKIEGVYQDEGAGSPGQVGTSWYGVLTELSVGF